MITNMELDGIMVTIGLMTIVWGVKVVVSTPALLRLLKLLMKYMLLIKELHRIRLSNTFSKKMFEILNSILFLEHLAFLMR
jgi:hypothetical protein